MGSDELMYSRILVEVVFPTPELGANKLDLDDALRDGLGDNYVVHCVMESEAMTEDRCEEVLKSFHRVPGY